ncbi:MAG: hypothetical protein ACI39T_03100, partial [Candidatus Cryptobacteroides sp.]
KNEVSFCGSEISTGQAISETANKSGHSFDTFKEQEPNAIRIPNNGTPDKTYFIDRNNNEYHHQEYPNTWYNPMSEHLSRYRDQLYEGM